MVDPMQTDSALSRLSRTAMPTTLSSFEAAVFRDIRKGAELGLINRLGAVAMAAALMMGIGAAVWPPASARAESLTPSSAAMAIAPSTLLGNEL